jgi:hypothetical protein
MKRVLPNKDESKGTGDDPEALARRSPSVTACSPDQQARSRSPIDR